MMRRALLVRLLLLSSLDAVLPHATKLGMDFAPQFVLFCCFVPWSIVRVTAIIRKNAA